MSLFCLVQELPSQQLEASVALHLELSYVSDQSQAQEDGFWYNYPLGIYDVVSNLSGKTDSGNLAMIFWLTKGIKIIGTGHSQRKLVELVPQLLGYPERIYIMPEMAGKFVVIQHKIH